MSVRLGKIVNDKVIGMEDLTQYYTFNSLIVVKEVLTNLCYFDRTTKFRDNLKYKVEEIIDSLDICINDATQEYLDLIPIVFAQIGEVMKEYAKY